MSLKSDEVVLLWGQQKSKMMQNIQDLYELHEFSDCNLIVGGKKLECHKLVLSSCSPFLKDIIENHVSEVCDITLDDISFEVACSMVRYIYLGEFYKR